MLIGLIIMGIVFSLIALFGLLGAVVMIADGNASEDNSAIALAIIMFLGCGFGAFVSFGTITAL